jgi:exosortase A-associated hydrolase 2
MNETPFFFKREDASLFGLLHSPTGDVAKTGFVVSHSFAEEKLWSHRVIVSFARALARRGYPVLRFDYMGAGDSTGDTPDTSLDSHRADFVAAVNELTQRVPALERVGVVGLRFGAAIAALVAEQGAPEKLRNGPLILWDPVLDGDAYFQELLRMNLSTQLAVFGKVQETREMLADKIRGGGTVNVDGYELGKALFESAGRADLLVPTAKTHAGPVLVMQITANEKNKNRDDQEALARAYGKGTFARSVEQPFWREIKPFYGNAVNLERDTLAWLERSLV